MLITTTPTIEGKRIEQYLGIVVGEAILGANVFRDLMAGLRDIVGGRSAAYERGARTSSFRRYRRNVGKSARFGGQCHRRRRYRLRSRRFRWQHADGFGKRDRRADLGIITVLSVCDGSKAMSVGMRSAGRIVRALALEAVSRRSSLGRLLPVNLPGRTHVDVAEMPKSWGCSRLR